MSARKEIIEKLRKQQRTRYEMPAIVLEQIAYPDLVTQFTEAVKLVGGRVVELKEGEEVDTVIASLYPGAEVVASALPDIRVATLNPDEVEDPHQLDNLDLAVIEGEIGVAENGAVWIPQQMRHKVICFIAEYLVILLDKKRLVATMHDAYKELENREYGFGVFISGPSKTADIEQALVVGAHGARGVTVLLK
ncbi:MAG: LUD domain-containing protein [Bacteroides sp.]|nr:LUD domain-containing protein [Bacteroides sp.]